MTPSGTLWHTLLVETFAIPAGVRVVVDADTKAQWTDVPGAVVLSGRSRRTIYHWMARGWVTVRRRASDRPEILVASLYASEAAEPAAQEVQP